MIFISHSFEDKDDYLNIADALRREDIKHFEPDTLVPGHSLQLKLREAISQCTGCIFVATRRSVQSPWCLAELGAFWGASKPVVIFVADSELSDEDIPPQFRDALRHRRISKIVEAAHEVETGAPGSDAPRSVGALTVPEFSVLIESHLARIPAAFGPRDSLRDLQLLLITELKSEDSERKKEELKIYLNKLLGMNLDTVSNVADTFWNYKGYVVADSGKWQVFGMRVESGPGRDIYYNCLLLFARGEVISACGAAQWVGGALDNPRLSDFHAVTGDPPIGKISHVS